MGLLTTCSCNTPPSHGFDTLHNQAILPCACQMLNECKAFLFFFIFNGLLYKSIEYLESCM